MIRGANDQMNLHWMRIPFGHLKSTQVVRLNRFELRGNILNTRTELPSLDIEVVRLVNSNWDSLYHLNGDLYENMNLK